ncbi:hypothetical protein PRZ48_005523 [Zasmidium cellare]|uniref:Uncharacterized protein n=1 Tax=Zasmidium cellare TaxID=395010 RepID=A0ABR0EKS1_ZASCE|nr:hypothetical protein PRZ48_005523 [Zasmidium cellare]
MGSMKAKKAQRARHQREKMAKIARNVLQEASGGHFRGPWQASVTLLSASITSPVPICTVRWADNSTSDMPLTKLLNPSITDTNNGLQQLLHVERLASSSEAQTLQLRPSSTALADLRQANEIRERLEAELREARSENLALTTQLDTLQESRDRDARAIEFMKSRAKKDILSTAKLKTKVRQLRSQTHILEAERRGLKDGEFWHSSIPTRMYPCCNLVANRYKTSPESTMLSCPGAFRIRAPSPFSNQVTLDSPPRTDRCGLTSGLIIPKAES